MPLTFEMARFVKFILTEIFPGGRLPSIEMVEEHSSNGGFHAHPRAVAAAALRQDPRPVGLSLEAHRDEAIEIQSEEVYERYMKYLTGCANTVPRRLHRRQPVHLGEILIASTDSRKI